MKKTSTHTRKTPPSLGLLGLLGFLGPILYIQTSDVTSLIFLAFFGFTGFYFEGKLSGTLKDERFKFNEYQATAVAGKVNSLGMVFILIITVNYIFPKGVELAFTFLITCLSLLWGFHLFLQGFLLYYYENKE